MGEGGVEEQVGAAFGDRGDEARLLESAEGVEHDEGEIGEVTGQQVDLPQGLQIGLAHRVDERHQADLTHPLQIPPHPRVIHRHALELGVERDPGQPELADAIDLGKAGGAVERLDHATPCGEGVGHRPSRRQQQHR